MPDRRHGGHDLVEPLLTLTGNPVTATMPHSRRFLAWAVAAGAAMASSGCGGGSSADGTPAGETHLLGGSVSGLSGSGLMLWAEFGAASTFVVVMGGATSFQFPTRLPKDAPYSVTVSQQPFSPYQSCDVANGVGVMASEDVVDVEVTCTTRRGTIGGSITGLTGVGLVLTAATLPDVAVPAGATSFTFPGTVASGTSFSVTVGRQPEYPRQTCTVQGGTGTTALDVTSIAVTCAADARTVAGSVTGLVGSGLRLGTPGLPDLTIPPGASGFSFEGSLPADGRYDVTVVAQPDGPSQTCRVVNGTGDAGGREAVGVEISCASAWAAVSAGGSYTLALRPDGTLWAWGYNADGRLGDGTTTQRNSPVQIGNGFAAIAAGSDGHSLAIKTDGTLWAWGTNSYGQLGDGTTIQRNSPVQIGTGFAAVSANGHSLALGADGTLWGWGPNTYGQVGTGATFLPVLEPVEIGTGYVSIAAGGEHSLGVKSDGTLWAWGNNDHGQLGDGTTTMRTSPVEIGPGFVSVAAGGSSSHAVKRDDSFWAWGGTSYTDTGGLGVGEYPGTGAIPPGILRQPVRIGWGFASASKGFGHTMAIKSDGTLWGWGQWESLGVLSLDRAPWRVVGMGVASTAAGHLHSTAVTTAGELVAWGDNSFGQLGLPAMPGATPTYQVVGSGYASSAVGLYHTVALKTDGTLWAWGDNLFGQLGDGTMAAQESPVQVGTDFAAVAAGLFHTMALKTDGTLWAWGDNFFGQLGDGTMVPRPTPAMVGSGYAAVSAGAFHTSAVKMDGTLWTWGNNGCGQLGDGTTEPSLDPVQIGSGFVAAAAGGLHTAALKADGTLWVWGNNDAGQIGDETTTSRLTPRQVGTDCVSVSAGWAHTAAVKSDGTLWTWGNNRNWQTGFPFGSHHNAPRPVGAVSLRRPFVSVSTGMLHTLAVDGDGELWSAGTGYSYGPRPGP
jgi:alpha-tubulin suppressor-like RCC1 family protein